MKSDYSFITENIVYSFSNVNSFNTCKYGWMLNYIEGDDKEFNCFAEFGVLVHSVLEKYFKYELELSDLQTYYADNYNIYVKS